MWSSVYLSVLALTFVQQTHGADQVRFSVPDYECPETNGKFPDSEECDLYYDCKDNSAEAVYCKNGLVFDFSKPNHEACVYPHKVDCSDRPITQPAPEGLDDRCEKENGYFNMKDVCTKYWNCDNGIPYEFPCAQTLFFDIGTGTCERKDALSKVAQKCEAVKAVDGFTCPEGTVVGPQGLVQAHPIYPHPFDCQFYFNCIDDGQSKKTARKFGCPQGKVFDKNHQVCKEAGDVPDCACWYGCPKDCEYGCKPNCSCWTKEDKEDYEDFDN